jgi:hypothetical protein
MVSVTYPRTFTIPMPTADEMRTLYNIAATAHPKLLPQLASATDEREFFAGFVAAFEIIAGWRRQPGLSKQRVDHWVDQANRFLYERGETQVRITQKAFMLAVVAAGDVDFVIERFPYDNFVNLTFDSTARAASPSWKTVLATRQTRAPLRVEAYR